MKAVNAAVALFGENPQEKSKALVVRAKLREEDAERLKDYDQAVQLDPSNVDAWQGRALVHMDQGDFDKAVADFNKLLERNQKNAAGHLALGEALMALEKYDEALKHIDQGIAIRPDAALGYTLRARLRLARVKEEDKEALDGAIKVALEDLNKALKADPSDVSALVVRANLHQAKGDLQAAREDVDRVLLLRPGLIQGLLVRSRIAAAEGKLSEAIADAKSVLESDAENVSWRMLLAGYYIQDKRPSKAIDIFTKILASDEDNKAARAGPGGYVPQLGEACGGDRRFRNRTQARPRQRRRAEQLRLGPGHLARR